MTSQTLKFGANLTSWIKSRKKRGRIFNTHRDIKNKKKVRKNVQKTPERVMIDQKQLKNVEYFKYLVFMTTNGSWSSVKAMIDQKQLKMWNISNIWFS
jgi:hypothetical protein